MAGLPILDKAYLFQCPQVVVTSVKLSFTVAGSSINKRI